MKTTYWLIQGIVWLVLTFAFLAFLVSAVLSLTGIIPGLITWESGIETSDWIYLIVYFIWTNQLSKEATK